MSADLSDAVRGWFGALEQCVERVDYEAAEPLFAEDVVSFGTRATLVTGRDALRAQQWSGIWPNVREFRFALDQLPKGIRAGKLFEGPPIRVSLGAV